MEQIAIIVGLLVCLAILFLFFRKKTTSHTDYGTTRLSGEEKMFPHPKDAQEDIENVEKASTSPENYPKSFEDSDGPLPCDGTCCSKNDICSRPERLFCRDVLSKILPKGKFLPQYYLSLPSGNRRIDFVFFQENGMKVAIELDGYKWHAQDIGPEEFDASLKRQNELVCHGWTVLRFSVSQLTKGTQYCIDTIKRFIPNNDITKICQCDEIFKDFPNCDKETADRLGLFYSGIRQKYYLPTRIAAKMAIPPSCETITWTKCPYCGEIARQRNGQYGLFWSCTNKSCRKTFNDPKV